MILRDREKMRNFDWEDWRKRYLKFMGMKRTKVIEFLKKIDRKQNGLIPRDVFVDETMKLSEFKFEFGERSFSYHQHFYRSTN